MCERSIGLESLVFVFLSFEAPANRTYRSQQQHLPEIQTLLETTWRVLTFSCLKCICVAPLHCICVSFTTFKSTGFLPFPFLQTNMWTEWNLSNGSSQYCLILSFFFSSFISLCYYETRWCCCSLAISILPEVPVFITLLQCKTSVSGLKTKQQKSHKQFSLNYTEKIKKINSLW